MREGVSEDVTCDLINDKWKEAKSYHNVEKNIKGPGINCKAHRAGSAWPTRPGRPAVPELWWDTAWNRACRAFENLTGPPNSNTNSQNNIIHFIPTALNMHRQGLSRRVTWFIVLVITLAAKGRINCNIRYNNEYNIDNQHMSLWILVNNIYCFDIRSQSKRTSGRILHLWHLKMLVAGTW